jgi:hypothetical protein
MSDPKKNDTVLNRDGKIEGTVRGDGRPCRQVGGCRGRQIPVRWADGKLTWPCTDGLKKIEKGWQIA